MEKSERFNLVLTPEDKQALQRLAAQERIPAAAVVRRLIWEKAQALAETRGDADHGRQREVLGCLSA